MEPPVLSGPYSPKEQAGIEREMTAAFNSLTTRWENRENDRDWMAGFVSGVRESSRKIFRQSSLEADTLFQQGFVDSTRLFVERVKEYDPAFCVADVYQALRNVWIMNTLQLYLDLPVAYSEAIFSYSMIYPYTDNIMDDTALSMQEKGWLNRRLKNWLEGEFTDSHSLEENPVLERAGDKIRGLIRLIEGQFPRRQYPDVFRSLLGIYNAQVRSLHQQKGQIIPHEADILGISIEKGGTSVLADGFLIRGRLSEKEADFCFGFGVFLQLADDIQDIAMDLNNGHMTIFSQAAGRYPLDKLFSKLVRFTASVVNSHLSEESPREKALRDIILKNSLFLVMEAVGRHRDYFTSDFVRHVQSHFPVRFGFLRRYKNKVQRTFLKGKTGVIDLDFASAFLLTLASRTDFGR